MTVELRGRAGFEAMNAVSGNLTRLSVADLDRFYFRIDQCDIGSMAASRIQVTPHRAGQGAIEDADVVNLFLVLAGGIRVESGRRRMSFSPGQITAQMGWNRHEAVLDSFSDELLLRIDRATLADRGVVLAPEVLHFGPEEATTTTRALSALVKSVLGAQALTEHAVPAAVENAVLELVVGLHHEGLGYGGVSNDLDQGLHARAVAIIATGYGDPELTPSTLAGTLGVGLRQLQRVFERAGTTAAREIRTKRLGHAITLLRDPHRRRLPLSEVAAMAGFSSTGELRRAMHAQYQVTPSQMRDRGLFVAR
ncbi:AraC family transcriptional regulator [Prescottella equi]|uniref:helix-turn-helix domain-containing protein n=1 Tax=Rhodococcus hoagii TaxID=43767 RepID=UPI002577893F|nr:AraC family transcriptional regulator [Prescottella equi]WJJ09786.1 AraC family transcriptional regulator [Prescottella equi]